MINLLSAGFSSPWLYRAMLISAAVAAFIMLNVFMKKGGFSKFVKKRVRRSFCWSAALALIFSNVANWAFHKEIQSLSLFDRFVKGGFSFIIWIVCFIGFYALFLRLYKLDVKKCLDIAVPSLLLATFFARIGCIFGGCCYGIGITLFENTVRFPIRLTEALFALTLSIVLCCAFKGKRLGIYLISYPTFRFFAEFLRGDNRGELFGIGILSPTQIISAVIVLMTSAVLIVKAVKKAKNKKTVLSSECVNAEDGCGAQSAGTVGTRKKHIPRPVDFNDPGIRSNPLRIIFNICLAIGVTVTAFFVYNPFGFKWVVNVNYHVQENLGFIFDEGGVTEEIGDSVGVSALDVSENGKVSNSADALLLIGSYDGWVANTYAPFEEKILSDGNRMYTFVQTVSDKPVIGKGVSLIVDKDNNPLFMIRDIAGETFSSDIISQYAQSDKTYINYMLAGYGIADKTDCLYDVGSGTVAAQLLLVSNGESSYAMIIETESERVLWLIEEYDLLPQNVRAQVIIEAAENVVEYLADGKTDDIKQQSKFKAKTLELNSLQNTVESALCKAYLKSGMNTDNFITALKTSVEIASEVPELNEQLFCDILSRVVSQTAAENGSNEKEAKSSATNVKRAFKNAGIKDIPDEKTVCINVGERKSVVKNSIGSASDVDIIKLHTAENSAIQFEISGDVSVDIEVYSEDGEHIVTTYSSSRQEFTLYPENGTDYVVKVKASESLAATWEKSKDYKVSVRAEEQTEQIPGFVNTVIYAISSSFASSSGSSFGLMFYGDEELSGDEYFSLAALPFVDNCTTACTGCIGEHAATPDSVKLYILEKLLVSSSGLQGVTVDPNTVMEISCFRFISVDNGALVKAKIKVTDSYGDSFEGYSFFRLELVTEIDEFDPDSVDNPNWKREDLEKLSEMLTSIFSNKYYITELNTDELLAAFGDSVGNISDTNGIPSLYDFWANPSGDAFSYIKVFDKEAALQAGHSAEQVAEFAKFTVRHNIAYCEKARENTELIYESITLFRDGLISGLKLYSFVDDPLDAIIDEKTDNMVIKSLYRIGKIAWGVSRGDITDITAAVSKEATGDFVKIGIKTYAEQLESDAAVLLDHINNLDSTIAEYEQELQQYGKQYFWENIF